MKKIVLLLPVLLLYACITINAGLKPGANTQKPPVTGNPVVMKPSTESLPFTDPADGLVYKWVKIRVFQSPEYYMPDYRTRPFTNPPPPTPASAMRVIPETGSFKDERDGQTYKTVTLGKQTWMAQNLNFKTADGSYYYNDDPKNGETYGMLYSFSVLKNACPKGWHIPSNAEWEELEYNAGMNRDQVWQDQFRGTIASDFFEGGATKMNVLFGGQYGRGASMGQSANFWTSTRIGNPITTRTFRKDDDRIDKNHIGEAYKLSVRCVKDSDVAVSQKPDNSITPLSTIITSPKAGSFVDKRDGQVYKTVTIGTQTWMAQNLNFKTASGCYIDEANRDKYGIYYDYAALKDACPKGWHIPTDKEWQQLEMTAGMPGDDARAAGYRGDVAPLFLPGGSLQFNLVYAGRHNPGEFTNQGQAAFFWSSTPGFNRLFRHGGHQDIYRGSLGSVFGMSVRCVKD